MARHFGHLVFTPVVKALQERYGSRRQYAQMEAAGASEDRLGEAEVEFIAERDSFYMASIGSTGWPYVQHRGGPNGFLKFVDAATLAFGDYRGNKQFVTAGNIATDDRVALILVDYPRQARLKILGHAEVLEGDAAAEWITRLQDEKYAATVERVFIIHVQAFDWNCPQHITARFTEEQIKEAIAPLERRLREVERENAQLRAHLTELERKRP
jgi:predicted pyridoxine 5'-phosphate oxidase superfamily flavin-nucleotide-binding protein